MKSRKTFTSLLVSIVTMMLCLCSFAGTTLAWFTDTVSNTGNKIQAGTLDVELYANKETLTNAGVNPLPSKTTTVDDVIYYDISNESTPMFNYSFWEPGYSTPAGFVIKNAGNLALKYKLSFSLIDSKTGLEELEVQKTEESLSGDVYNERRAHLEKCEANSKLENVIEVYQGTTKLGTLKDFFDGTKQFEGELLPDKTASISNLKLLMPTTAGNEYENASISFDIKLLATQKTYEKDGFNSDQYDAQATFPVVGETKVEPNKDTIIKDYDGNNNLAAQAKIPAAAQGEGGALAGASKVEMTVDETDKPTGITVQTNEKSVSYDVKFFSVAENGNKTPITDFGSTVVSVDLSAQIPDGADLMRVYHTHNGVSTEMEKITTSATDVTDGKFYYDVTTKILTVGSSTFSPFTFVYKEYVAYIEGRGGYETLGDALYAVHSGETLKLLKDVEYSNTISEPCNFTFDLNGKTLDFKGTSNAVFESALNQSTWNDYYAVDVKNGTIKSASSESVFGCYGNLTLKNVKIDYAGSDYVIDLKGNNYDFKCNANIEDCEITSSGKGILIHAIKGYIACQTSLNIKNTTLNVTGSAYNAYAIDCQAGKLTIESCNIASSETAIYNVKSMQASGVTSDITIKGETSITANTLFNNASGAGTISIIEGKYNFDPTTYVNPESFDIAQVDNKWVVTAKN